MGSECEFADMSIEWPDISVLIPTYNRADIVHTAVVQFMRNIVYPGKLIFYIGIDGDDNTREVLESITGANIVCLDGPRRQSGIGSLGANLNMLISSAKSDFLFQMDDDHILIRKMSLAQHVERLVSDQPRSGWIRLMWIGGHKYTATLDGAYWVVDWNSAEVYITSNRPHLKRKDFHSYYGMYPEGLKLGQTEEWFCHQCIDMAKADGSVGPHVLIPLGVRTEDSWDHIGHSWQLQGE